MRVQEIMTGKVRTVPPTMAAIDAWELMKNGRIHHLVVTRGSEVVGVLSDRDAGGRAGVAVRSGRTVGDLMTTKVVTIGETGTVREAANLMRGRTMGCLPVLRKGRLVGIVTTSDLLVLLGRGSDRPLQADRPTATHRVPHRHRNRSAGAW